MSEPNAISKYLVEYLFMSAVDSYNATLEKEAKRRIAVEHPKIKTLDDYQIPFILTREANAIHDIFSKKAYNSNGELISSNLDDVIASIEKSFEEAGRMSSIDVDPLKDVDISNYANGLKDTFVKQYNSYTADNLVPLSPYDEFNRNKKAFIDNGEKCLFVESKDLKLLETGRKKVMLMKQQNDGLYYEAGWANIDTDKANVSQLYKYAVKNGTIDPSAIKKSDKVQTVIEKAFTSNKDETKTIYKVNDDLIKKAENILNTLTDLGLSYSLATTDKPGQLDAIIEGTKLSVRLIDVNEDAYTKLGQYNYGKIGQIYDRATGTRIYNSVSGGTQEQKNIIENVSNMELRPLLYYYGKNIPDKNGNEIDITPDVIDVGRNKINRIYHGKNSDDYSNLLAIAMDKIDGSNLNYALAVSTPRRKKYLDKDEAKKDLSLAVTNAREDVATDMFVKMVDLDKLAKDFANTNERTRTLVPPELSDNTVIADVQKSIWKYLVTNSKTDPDGSAHVQLLKDANHVVQMANVKIGNQTRLESFMDTAIGSFDISTNGTKLINPVSVFNYINQGKEITPDSIEEFGALLNKADVKKEMLLPDESKTLFDQLTKYVPSENDPADVIAKMKIAVKVNEARRSFVNLIDLDGLIAEDKKYDPFESLCNHYLPDDRPLVPSIASADPVIEDIQTQIWKYLGKVQSSANEEVQLIDPNKKDELEELMKLPASPERSAKIEACYIPRPDSADLGAILRETGYLEKLADYYIGNFDVSGNGKFDPVNVLNYVTTGNNRFSDNDNLADLMGKARLNKENILMNHDEPLYNNLLDRSVQYNPDTAVTFKQKINELNDQLNDSSEDEERAYIGRTIDFYKNVEKTIGKSLQKIGIIIDQNNLRIDDNGVVEYTGVGLTNQNTIDKKGKPTRTERPFIGHLGQIIAPDKNGVIVTKFKSGDNSAIIPGYTAYYETDNPLDHKKPIERMVCVGYEKNLLDSIRTRITQDYMSASSESFENIEVRNGTRYITLGTPFSLNSVPRKVTHESIKGSEEYEKEYLALNGKTDKSLQIKILQHRDNIRLTSEYIEGATIKQHLDHIDEINKTGRFNDNFATAFNKSGRDMGNSIPDGSKGYLDQDLTGNTTNTGKKFFKVKDAKIDPITGHILPARKADGSIDTEARSELWEADDSYKYSKWDSQERIEMNLTGSAHEITEVDHVGFAMISGGGWNMEDGVVISKEFAEKVLVPVEGKPGQYRHLMKRDKLSDSHGNKGVIALIVDRDMPIEEAKAKGIDKIVQVFRDNPHLDYASSPYSLTSRSNGGTYVEANDSETETLHVLGRDRENSLGYIKVHVYEQTVDHKTKVDDADRKFGSQATWALLAKGAGHIIKEIYSHNDVPLKNLQEYLNVLGVCITPDGRIDKSTFVQKDINKHIIDISADKMKNLYDREIRVKPGVKQNAGTLTTTAFDRMVEAFKKEADLSGGNMLLPFKLKLASGLESPEHINEQTGKGDGYLLSVLTPKLRSETVLMDGETKHNEYTRYYENIYENAVRYKFTKDLLDKIERGDAEATTLCGTKLFSEDKTDKEAIDGVIKYIINNGKKSKEIKETNKTFFDLSDNKARNDAKEKLKKKLKEMVENAQDEYNDLVSKITQSNGPLDETNKKNIVKASIAGARTNGATMVISADPTLNIGEIAMSRENAIKMGILDKRGNRRTFTNIYTGKTENVGVLMYRDPVLRAGAMRYAQVVIKDDCGEGIAINPVAYKCQDGDFDGDTEAVLPLKTKEALSQASMLMSYEANMIDISQKATREVDGTQIKPLFMNTGLDLAAGEASNPMLKKKYESIENDATILESKITNWNTELNGFINKHSNLSPEDLSTLQFDNELKKSGIPGNNLQEYYSSIQSERKAVMTRYSEYVKDALEVGTGRHVISFGDLEQHINSVLETANDGAKGSPSKVEEYANKSLNAETKIITEEVNGHKIGKIEKLKNCGKLFKEDRKPGFTERDKRDALIATCAKTIFAGIVGEQSKKAMASVGLRDPRVATETTYNPQQTLMQAKKSKDRMGTILNCVISVYPAFLNASPIEKVDDNGNIIPLDKCLDTKGTWQIKKKHEPLYRVEKGDDNCEMLTETELKKLCGEEGKAYFEDAIKGKGFYVCETKKTSGANDEVSISFVSEDVVKKTYAKFNNSREKFDERLASEGKTLKHCTLEKHAVRNVPCTMSSDEWKNTAKVFFTDKDGLGLDSFDTALLNKFGDGLDSVGNKILGVRDSIDLRESLVASMIYAKKSIEKMIKSYGPEKDAKRPLEVFGGYNCVSGMEPNVLLKNKEAIVNGELEKIRPICTNDTLEGGQHERKQTVTISTRQDEYDREVVIPKYMSTGGMKM